MSVLKLGSIVLILGTAACSGVPTVNIPVAVSCVEKRPERPQFRSDSEILVLDDYRAVLALRAERLKAQKYIGELEDVVTACERAPSVVTLPPA